MEQGTTMPKARQPGRQGQRKFLSLVPQAQRRSVMFEKISRAAETLATNVSVSRRGFLGEAGMASVGALAGMLFSAGEVQARWKLSSCVYYCPNGGYVWVHKNNCSWCISHATYQGCPLLRCD